MDFLYFGDLGVVSSMDTRSKEKSCAGEGLLNEIRDQREFHPWRVLIGGKKKSMKD